MPLIRYRQARRSDIPAIARVRAAEWGSEEYWISRITAYLNRTSHPQHALAPRVAYIAASGHQVVGLVAGHLTTRHGCRGELEWIDVHAEHRRKGIAEGLLRKLAAWFVAHQAHKICVDVQPTNAAARAFYAKHGAIELNPHWMVWNRMGDVAGAQLREPRTVPAAMAKRRRRVKR